MDSQDHFKGRRGSISHAALVVFCVLLVACGSSGEGELPEVVDFNFHIKPILSDRCFACHGPDEKAREAELSLHTPEGAFALLDSAAGMYPVAPGKPAHSAILHRISSDDPELVMPPPASNLQLTDREIALIERWIKQGAEWKSHWAFIPPEKSAVPKARNTDLAQNEVDHFIQEKLRAQGLKPADTESPEKLLRRLSFDLTGLPPSPQMVERLVTSNDEDTYNQIVDELLASAHYGERMASTWLDIARYSDSHGYQDDRPRVMWPWRDWVVRAFNDNLPYDEFVTWQLAGDLLPEATYDQRLATGFNRNHAITQEGGVIEEEYLNEYAADRTQTFATSFLGLTMECSRCHDHKYDPISQEEFYQLYGFFNNVKDERGRISYFDQWPEPNLKMQDPVFDQEVEAIKEAIGLLEDQMDKLETADKEFFEEWMQGFDPNQIDLRQGLQAYQTFDHREAGGWADEVSGHAAKTNINLPPRIDHPMAKPGIHGESLAFNGDNFASLGDVADFEHYQSFSLTAWIKHTNQHEEHAGIIARRNGELNRAGIDFSIDKHNKIHLVLTHQVGEIYLDVETTRSLSPHRWYHIAASYDGSGQATGIRIYVDGKRQPVRIKHDLLMGRSILTGNDLLVGNWNHRARKLGPLGGFAGGTVDEVRVYDKRLSELEVRKIYEGEGRSDFHPSRAQLYEHYMLNYSTAYRQLKHQADSLRSRDTIAVRVMVMEERDTIRPAYFLDRGAYDAPVKKVNRGTPTAVLAFSEDLPQNRLGLAQWLFREEHPLTARVMVNRLWQQCFGKGLVATPEDFGSQGDLPSHPELLDWLAVKFVEMDWDIKAMLKLLVQSHTYRQSSSYSKKQLAVDSDNKWLSRGPSAPLSAEMVRDQALAVSGLLYDKVGGKWVKPYQPAGIWKELANQIGENKYRQSFGQDLYRRSLYTYWKRTIPPPTMLTLDAPERAVCTVKRQATSTPLQSLILLNDPQYIEASRVLASDLPRYDGAVGELLDMAFERITSRAIQAAERDALLQLHAELEHDFAANREAAKALVAVGSSVSTAQVAPETLAALTTTISTIFNLDEAKFK